MPTSDRGGAVARIYRLRRAPATSENSNGAGKPSASRQPRTSLPASSYGALMAREQTPAAFVGMSPATVRELHKIGRSHPASVGRFPQRVAADWRSVATQAPRGLAALAKAEALDARDFATPETGKLPGGGGGFPRTRALLRGVTHATYQDLRHPLRHPGYTFLDAVSVGKSVASIPRVARATALTAREVAAGVKNVVRNRKAPSTRTPQERRAAANRTRAKTLKVYPRAVLNTYGLNARTIAQPPAAAFTLGRRGNQMERVAQGQRLPKPLARAFALDRSRHRDGRFA